MFFSGHKMSHYNRFPWKSATANLFKWYLQRPKTKFPLFIEWPLLLYSHEHYTYTYACRTQQHNKDERLSSLEKYTSHFIWKGSKELLKVLLWEGLGNRTELQHIDPHSYGHNSVSFPISWAHSAGCWFSLPHLISNRLNFLCTELYNSSTPTFFLWVSQIALIQPVHGQGYILIFLDRMHLLFTQVHFLFW